MLKTGLCKIGIPVTNTIKYIDKLENLDYSFIIYDYNKENKKLRFKYEYYGHKKIKTEGFIECENCEYYKEHKCVSTLLNTSNWSSFVNTSYADYAIGGPTIEMFCASWNQMYTSQKIYCNKTGTYGYYFGKSSSPTTVEANLSSYTGYYSNTLYYPHKASWNSSNGYWLSSPHTNGYYCLQYVNSNGLVGGRRLL